MLTVCCNCCSLLALFFDDGICLSDVLKLVAHCRHNLIAVPDSVQKEVNLSVWLDDELLNHPQLQPLARSLPSILVQDRAPRLSVHMFGHIKHGRNGPSSVVPQLYLLIL